MTRSTPESAARSTYDRPAHEYYATLAGWRGYSYARRRARLLPLLSGLTLDVACGDGRIVLTALGERGVGLDLSASMLAAARVRAPRSALARGDAHELPFRDASFDTVVVSHALWLFASPSQFLFDARRVLRASGRLVVVSNHRHYFAARSLLLRTLAATGRRHEEPPPILHRQRAVERALERHGFTEIRSESFLVVPVPGFARLDRTPLRRLGLSFVTEGRKPG